MPDPIAPAIARLRQKFRGDLPDPKPGLPKRIATERLILRRLRLSDARSIFSYASDPENVIHLPFRPHTSLEDALQYVKYTRQAWRSGKEFVYGILRASDQQFIGTIGFENENGKACLGYVLAKAYWNQGYASEAAAVLVRHLKELQYFDRIWAFCDADNLASRRVLTKAGLREEAVIRKWVRFVNQSNQFKDCVFFAVVPDPGADSR